MKVFKDFAARMKRSKLMLMGMVLLVCVGAVLADDRPQHTKDSLETVQENLTDDKAVMVDVREQREWDAGHLKKAKLVPLSKLRDLKGKAEIEGLAKDKIVYVHCKAGGRALSACTILKEMGYDVRPLKWGYTKLVDEGFEKAEK